MNNFLVVGSGAREHVIAWMLASSKKAGRVIIAPGNAGTAEIGINVNVKATDFAGLEKVAEVYRINCIVVGPEDPLAMGIVDYFQTRGVPIFGPRRAAARIESEKNSAKELMRTYGIPCAASKAFTTYESAMDYLSTIEPPYVIKVNGLAAGKGVTIAKTKEEAEAALRKAFIERAFGDAGNLVLIEEYLEGKEVSKMVFTDGRSAIPLVPAHDYKRACDGNQGPNTGGMGSYSSPASLNPELDSKIFNDIMVPLVTAMRVEGNPFTGLLYGGLMITPEGLRVLEINARPGDPETQVQFPRLKTDLADIIESAIDGNLGGMRVEWSEDSCVGVIAASPGYPESPQTGFPIKGLKDVDPGVMVFHGGTKLDGEGQIITSGGRVLTVVARAKTLPEAREIAYDNIRRISFKGMRYRTDIAAVP